MSRRCQRAAAAALAGIFGNRRATRINLITALCCLLAACAGQQAYRSEHRTNLFITTDTETPGLFSAVDASLDIYRMHDICDVEYRGTVDLDDPLVGVGVPEGVPAYLVFRIDRSAFLTNSQSSVGYDLALYPEYDRVYDVNVVYRNNIYDVEVVERARGGSDGERLAIGMFERACTSESI